MAYRIPFNQPLAGARAVKYLTEVCDEQRLSGDGRFTQQCHEWLESHLQVRKALMTTSGTSALDMAAILTGLQSGDEVIMPSFTFSSSANAIVLRGAVPVFVDIREDTLNIDERLIEAAITPRTRAIMVVHYAGVACAMDPIMEIAARHGLAVIEDAAQAILSSYRGRPLGSIGQFGALSFHETKNISSGEGGALLINDAAVIERAEIIREKGTNRMAFARGEIQKYTWVDLGSSYLPSELISGFLWSQLEIARDLTDQRVALWNRYHAHFADLEAEGFVRRPHVPDEVISNGHIYYLLLPTQAERDALIANLRYESIYAVFHYVPLHSAPAGLRFARTNGPMTHTDDLSSRLVRLPLWMGLNDNVDVVAEAVKRLVKRIN
ncbi:dTDP-4-amino-4,6-dideoxygalactose transaminase [Rhodopseudomonas sp. P2A-2r]|uniref:dTDP-4-amino-4,6-dideoxygalactose transaminase n=1 Tax=Rhodopseudomonas sp. P2A-2r TaxID=2991972 RepID=UPI0022346F4A|nr:dTDP-4-amino-4,6-dideoxygalactose transaminase [Rhodopseudomonas sp. P2A-2r]UZE48101.1 dTDP-4-amino-4,6-dideoxygalactose transaminase [Rhodopseudomonas sp. P2A-2r]